MAGQEQGMRALDRRGFGLLALASGTTLLLPGAARAEPMPQELRDALEREELGPVLGNPDGDITLVEFLDYNCPACRETAPVLPRLVAADPKLRIVIREWPIFGEGSDFAAAAALASLQQRKYPEFHTALMALNGPAAEASVMRAAGQLGLDAARLKRDMEAESVANHVWHSHALADHIGLVGTPTFIAGNDGAFGGQSLQQLQALVAEARKALL